jgi:hypothetical protein
MSLTCLSRTLDPKDYDHLGLELPTVDAHPNTVPHEHRRWEYALALQAVGRWRARGGPWEGPLYDIGGAGSAFSEMLADWTGREVLVVDPAITDGYTLEQVVEEGGAPLSKVVTCLSVIEHVKDLDRFCYHLSCLVAPGGLLVLTMDYWNKCGPDTTGNKDLRERLFCPKTYGQLRQQLGVFQLTAFGGVDPAWHGTHVWDYSFASLVLEKRR